jgi:hypothetical protein
MSVILKVLFAFILFAPFTAGAVTVASWGGAYTESQKKAYADTWSDPSSVKFEKLAAALKPYPS